MSMLGISDDVSLPHKSVIDLDDNDTFPNLPTAITKDPITKRVSTSDTSIPTTSKSMSTILEALIKTLKTCSVTQS